jgi:hypothetical protein
MALLLLTVVAACGDDGDADPQVQAGGGDQRYEGSFTLLESAEHGPELCHEVFTSLPPQCGGPSVVGWDWDAVDGEKTMSGTTWGGALARIREHYAGPLCVIERDGPTTADLAAVRDELIDEDTRSVLGAVEGTVTDERRGVVVATVWVADENAKDYAAQRWGALAGASRPSATRVNPTHIGVPGVLCSPPAGRGALGWGNLGAVQALEVTLERSASEHRRVLLGQPWVG